MRGNSQVRFLGGLASATTPAYPTCDTKSYGKQLNLDKKGEKRGSNLMFCRQDPTRTCTFCTKLLGQCSLAPLGRCLTREENDATASTTAVGS